MNINQRLAKLDVKKPGELQAGIEELRLYVEEKFQDFENKIEYLKGIIEDGDLIVDELCEHNCALEDSLDHNTVLEAKTWQREAHIALRT